MLIKSISIKNYRGFEEKTLNFNSNFNVLIGGNGSGKTSILDALSLGISSFFLGIDDYYSKSILKTDIHRKSFVNNFEYQLPVEINCKGLIDGRDYNWMRDLLTLNGNTRQSKDTKKLVEIAALKQNQVRKNEKVNLPVFSYYGTGRLWKERKSTLKTKSKSSRFDGYLNSTDPESNSKTFLRWIKTQEIAVIQKTTDELLLTIVKGTIGIFLEKTQRVYFDVVEDTLMLEYLDINGAISRLPWEMLSDGFRNIIAMAADLAYRCIVLNPQMGAFATEMSEGVVLIDEIDLHLHPNWQRKIVDSFKKAFPRIQFIVTTHSPFIVQSLKNDELIDLEGKELTDDYIKKGIEDIVEGEMGVHRSNRSLRFIEMQKAADEYYKLILDNKEIKDQNKIERLKEKLDNLIVPFYDDPAYVAYLESFKHQLDA